MNQQAIHRATQLAWQKKYNKMEIITAEMVHLSTEHSVGCRVVLHDPPDRLGNGQPASPTRRMAHRPNLDLFISCFQNDISLATEDQQAWPEQRSSVSWSQTNTGRENMPRSRQAETDRATKDHPLTSA